MVKESDGGIVRRVVLLDDAGDEVALVTRFLSTATLGHWESKEWSCATSLFRPQRLYKAESIRTTLFCHGPYKTLADVEYATASWVD